MTRILATERAAAIFGISAIASLLAIAAGAVALGAIRSGRPGPSADAAAKRLEVAVVARRDPHRGDQFDAEIRSLESGLGTDTPPELAAVLTSIDRGRTVERMARSPTDASNSDVDKALALACRVVGREESRAADARSTRESVLGTVALVAMVPIALALASALLLVRALRFRKVERRAIAALYAIDESSAHDGGLVASVGRRIAGRRPDKTARPASCDRPVEPAEGSEPCVGSPSNSLSDGMFGRVLEIVAVDE